MKVGNSYCVEVNYGLPREPTISTRSKPTSTISTGNGVVTPTPTQPSMVGNCNKFYKVQQGDSCDEIAINHGISGADFAKWNPKVHVGAQCTGLWADAYACVGVLNGGDPTVTDKPSTTTSAGNGIATPGPTQPNMVDNCNKLHFVKKGDSCADILSSNGISMDDFVEPGQSCQDIASRNGITVSDLTS